MKATLHSLLAKRAAAKQDDKGFTLIELLVVVLIIGILAAIAIPVFLGQQDQAKNAAAKSDLSNAKIAAVAYGTEKGGTYTGASETTLANYGFVETGDAELAITVPTGGAVFCISVAGAGDTTWAASDKEAPAEGTCSSAGVFVPAS